MLQRCRPKALKTVTVVENELITPETLMRISTASSTPISHSESGGSNNSSSKAASSINNNSVSNPLSSPITSSLPNSDYLLDPETELHETTGLPAVKVLRYCDNSFELFERGDGSSKIVFYKPKEKKLDFGEENNINDNKDNKTDNNIKLSSQNTNDHHDIENPQGEESKEEEVGSPIHFSAVHSVSVNNNHNNINNNNSSGSNHNSLNSEVSSLPIAEAVIVERKEKDPPTDV
jgi:hypothetical protein